ncbi:hypothetical protein UFOVP1323_22 [uncultured Caudovirales phage]|uniref:Uncharacterized protein n=1 Tax=uncultured Caudovirales phage TaxID=2100421 RepID=A0A6J5RUW5_9CAUD|nr:hypothetical protein UFOVP1323_22 [uncultured Caudovirales phage]
MLTEKSDKVTWLNQISLGNVITILGGIVAVGMIYGTTLTRVQAIETKIDINDQNDRKSLETLGAAKEKISEIQSEQKSFRRDIDRIGEQLTRIENLLRRPIPTSP